LTALNNPIATIAAEHTEQPSGQLGTDVAEGLAANIFLGIRAEVMIVKNLAVKLKLANGMCANIFNTIYLEGTSPPALPAVIVLQLPSSYDGPPCLENIKGIVPGMCE